MEDVLSERRMDGAGALNGVMKCLTLGMEAMISLYTVVVVPTASRGRDGEGCELLKRV